MKALSFFLFAALSAAGLSAQAQTAPATAKAVAGTETVKFKTSAVCDMCKARIEKSMAYEKGVQSATLDVPTKVLTVNYRPEKTNAATLRTAVQKTGYDADDQTAEIHVYSRLPECCKKTAAAH